MKIYNLIVVLTKNIYVLKVVKIVFEVWKIFYKVYILKGCGLASMFYQNSTYREKIRWSILLNPYCYSFIWISNISFVSVFKVLFNRIILQNCFGEAFLSVFEYGYWGTILVIWGCFLSLLFRLIIFIFLPYRFFPVYQHFLDNVSGPGACLI